MLSPRQRAPTPATAASEYGARVLKCSWDKINDSAPFRPRCVKGVCAALDAQTYRCDCEEGYGGALCHLRVEPAGWCQGLRCVHGQCEQTEDGGRCVCQQGYTGERCDTGEEGSESS